MEYTNYDVVDCIGHIYPDIYKYSLMSTMESHNYDVVGYSIFSSLMSMIDTISFLPISKVSLKVKPTLLKNLYPYKQTVIYD
jgi:homogentisate 1,2-dioxygenase